MARWLPVAILVAAALAYEPIRSGFTFANQTCDLTANRALIWSAVFNLRHIISYGILFLACAATFRENRIAKAALATFAFSAFIEFEQSFFATGHCRARDLIPNLLGIGLATILFMAGERGLKVLR